MPEKQLTIINKLGLHARAAAKFVATAKAFGCKIQIVKEDRVVDGKSIMAVMMLAARQGSSITVRADGEDAEAALTAIEELIADYFGEGE